MFSNLDNNQKNTIVFVIIALAVFVFLPWVSTGYVQGIYESPDDVKISLSGLDIVQYDYFKNTQPSIIVIAVGALIASMISVLLSIFLKPYYWFDPFIRSILGLVTSISMVYILYLLLFGEVGMQSVGVFGGLERPTDGLYIYIFSELPVYLLVDLPSAVRGFNPGDFMNIHIGPIAILVAGILIFAQGERPGLDMWRKIETRKQWEAEQQAKDL